jgi:hypothetical protein
LNILSPVVILYYFCFQKNLSCGFSSSPVRSEDYFRGKEEIYLSALSL